MILDEISMLVSVGHLFQLLYQIVPVSVRSDEENSCFVLGIG